MAKKGLECFYSATGNTKLAMEFILKRLSIQFDNCDVSKDPVPDFSQYSIVGFASPVDWLEEPQRMRLFMDRLPTVNDVPAFVFVTNGGMPGKTLSNLAKAAEKKGFRIISAFALRVPDSYPPLLAGGHKNVGMPNDRELEEFNSFIKELDQKLKDIEAGKDVKQIKVGAGIIGTVAAHFGRDKSKRSQGPKFVDVTLCTKCGKCQRGCPYKAIKLDPFPKFDENLCYGCWACYNRCPVMAIYTKKLRGKGHYPGPTQELKQKLDGQQEPSA